MSIFRKVALERLSSPEELDQLISVTKPRGWIALLGLIGILGVSILWGFYGSIPIKINGMGMITASEGVTHIIHPVSGRITDVGIEPGDYVRKGDIIGRLEIRELINEINTIKRDIELANSFDIKSFGLENLELSSGLSSLYDIALKIKDQQAQGSSDKALLDQLELTRAIIISELTTKLNKAVEDMEAYSSIVSHVEGRVLEVDIEKGQIIQAGESATSIIRDDQTVNSLEVVLYVSPEEGKQIRPGMDAHISPTIVNKEDYGYMLGKVISVSDYPTSSQTLIQTLGSQELADLFSKDSAPIEVRVNLIPDSSTISGLKWSTAQGPPIQIDSGNICTGSIVIDKRRPVEMVIPAFTRVFD